MDDGLFADLRPVQPADRQASDPDALPGWQVASMRKALDDLGLVAMEDRQALIEELAGRQVTSLRDLTFAEARAISEAMSSLKNPTGNSGSTWDNRDEDTWIDRL